MYNKLIGVFVTVADLGSFSKAARKHYCSSVSIMKRMNDLEEHLGVQLFHRTTQGVTLTKAGASVYQDAKKIMALSREATAKAQQIAESRKRVIRVGTSMLRPCKPLIELLSTFEDTDLPFRLKLVSFDDSNIHETLSMLEKDFDCFIGPCGRTKWLEDFSVHFLGEYRCCLSLSRKHRLANKEMLSWDDLDGESILLVKEGESTILDKLRDDLKKHHPLVNIIDSPNFFDLDTFNHCEKMNYLIESVELWKDIHPSLATVPVDWEYEIPYGIIYSKQPTQLMSDFIQFINQYTVKQ